MKSTRALSPRPRRELGVSWLRWHPDKNGQSDESLAMMQTLNAAKAACLQRLAGPAPG